MIVALLDHQHVAVHPPSPGTPLLGGPGLPAPPRSGRRQVEPAEPGGGCLPPLDEYISNILMPTSVHIPKPLLDAVDRRARALRISRNHLIVLALEREMKQVAEWSPGFFERLAEVDDATSRSVDELMAAVRSGRRSKEPQRL